MASTRSQTVTTSQARAPNTPKRQGKDQVVGRSYKDYSDVPEGRKQAILDGEDDESAKQRREDEADFCDLLGRLQPEELANWLKEDAKNGDDVLDHFRKSLSVVVASDQPDAREILQNLENGMSFFTDLNWQPIRDQVLDWAKRGYPGTLEKKYFDNKGRERQRVDDTDPSYEDVDMPLAPESPGLPDDMDWARQHYERASPFVSEALLDPNLDRTKSCYSSLDRINQELRRESTKRSIVTDLTVPIATLVVHLPQCVMEEIKMRLNKGSGPQQSLEMLQKLLESRAQPVAWIQELRRIAEVRAKEMLEDPRLADAKPWGDALRRLLASDTDPARVDKLMATKLGTKGRKINVVPGQVRYEKESRPIGAIRMVGRACQVFVQWKHSTEENATVWHVLPASRFSKEAVRQYQDLSDKREITSATKGTFKDLKDVDLDDFEILGVAYHPVKEDNIYGCKPMQLVLTCVSSTNVEAWYDFTTMAKRFGREDIQEALDDVCERAGDAGLANRLASKGARVRDSIKTYRRKMQKHGVDEDLSSRGDDVEHEPSLVQEEDYERDWFVVSDREDQ